MATVVALMFPAGFVVPARASGSAIVLNELLWMGSPSSSADEWIELRNLGSDPVDLSGWRLARLSSGSEVTMLTVPAGRTIGPGGFFLISNFGLGTSTQLAVPPDLVDPAVSLLNSGLLVKLYDASGALIDTADDGSGSPLAGRYTSGTTYAAMARNGVPGDGAQAGSWHTARTSANLLPGSIVLGTPGAPNDNVAPKVPTVPDQRGVVGQELAFDASDAVDPDGAALTYQWDFGDGGSSGVVTPTHTYAVAGSFTVSLRVGDGIDETVVTSSVTVEPVATLPVTPTTDQVRTVPGPSGRALLSELLPNPVGSDDGEFIELEALEAGSLAGWSIEDAAGTIYRLPGGPVIAAGTFVQLPRGVTKVALNNDREQVRLRDPSGTMVEEVAYTDGEEGASYSRSGSTWAWSSQPTPGAANVIVRPNHPPVAKLSVGTRRRAGEPISFDGSDATDPDGDALSFAWDFGDGQRGRGRAVEHVYRAEGSMVVTLTVSDKAGLNDVEQKTLTVRTALQATTSGGKVRGAATTATIRSAADVRTAKSTAPVQLRGVVTAPPKILGERLFYLVDERGQGIGVRSEVTVPELTVGSVVAVRGKRRSLNSEPYILISERSGLVVSEEQREVQPGSIAAAAIDTDVLGNLVRLEGEVTAARGGSLTVDDGTAEATVYVRSSTGIRRPALRTGDRVAIVGIVSRTSSGIRILPRFTADIELQARAAPVASPVQTGTPSPRSPAIWAYAVVVVVAAVAAGVAWRRRAA